MVTKTEAIHSGEDLGKNYAGGKIENEAIANFTRSLRDVDQQDAKNHTHLKWDELSAASKSLEDKHVLPKLGFDDKAHEQRVARVIGTTADQGKPDGERNVVVALGHKDGAHARDVVILGHDGKYYQAREVSGGFVKTDNVVAKDADELEQKYKANKIDKPLKYDNYNDNGDVPPPPEGKQPKVTHEPGTGRVTSVRDADGHERQFMYDQNGQLTEFQIDGHKYEVGAGGTLKGNDWSTRTVHTDSNGRLIIDRSYWGNNSGMPNEQVIINTDGSIDRFEMGVWTHLQGVQANKVYAELQQQLKPKA